MAPCSKQNLDFAVAEAVKAFEVHPIKISGILSHRYFLADRSETPPMTPAVQKKCRGGCYRLPFQYRAPSACNLATCGCVA